MIAYQHVQLSARLLTPTFVNKSSTIFTNLSTDDDDFPLPRAQHFSDRSCDRRNFTRFRLGAHQWHAPTNQNANVYARMAFRRFGVVVNAAKCVFIAFQPFRVVEQIIRSPKEWTTSWATDMPFPSSLHFYRCVLSLRMPHDPCLCAASLSKRALSVRDGRQSPRTSGSSVRFFCCFRFFFFLQNIWDST